MKFIICIKQVPDVASPLLLRDGALVTESGRLVLNAYDASAVEEALVLTEKHGGEVHLVLAGPQRAQETIRKALAMGADAATHLQIEDETLDSRAYAKLLAEYLSGESYDVIACGKQAQDTDAGLTGSMLAELLDLPYAANAVGLEIENSDLVVTRQGDTGQEIISLPTPCLVTCSNDMNEPRIPNLKGIMAAKRKTIAVRPVERRSAEGGPSTRIRRYETTPSRDPGRILEGEVDEVVSELVDLLKNRAKVI
ncbi:MAG: electron transfer flavoprotein subunit beta/FixA family protein [Rhodothermales bacterium]